MSCSDEENNRNHRRNRIHRLLLSNKLSKTFDITLIDIKEPKQALPKDIRFQKCDITNYTEVKAAVENVDLVIHTSIIQIPAINDNKKLGYQVNIIGTQNVCRAVDESPKPQGLILCGSWHTIGEREISGIINEEFGFRPDKVEDRARLYALAKMAQEAIVRFYDEMTGKTYGIIRMGTVLERECLKKQRQIFSSKMECRENH